MSTPCAGKWELFDSNDPSDHHVARILCETCPVIAACREALELATADAHVPDKYGPAGTWAGQLVGSGPAISAARIKAEDAMFTDAELRTAHADYAAGFRSPRTVTAERIYQRKRSRIKYAARKKAA